MKRDIRVANSEHMITIDKAYFGYVVSHVQGKYILFTGSYQGESAAMRIAKRLAKRLKEKDEVVTYYLNHKPVNLA